MTMSEILLFNGYLLIPTGKAAIGRQKLKSILENSSDLYYLKDRYFSEGNELRDYGIITFAFDLKTNSSNVGDVISHLKTLLMVWHFYAVRIYVEYELSETIEIHEYAENTFLSKGDLKILEYKKDIVTPVWKIG